MKQGRPINTRNPKHAWWLVAVIGALVTAAAQDSSDLSSSVVRITTQSGQGSGVVVSVEPNSAIILTAYHVIAGTERYEVVFGGAPGRGTFQVTTKRDLIGWQSADETYGLAAFRVRGAIPNEVRAATLSGGTTLERGDPLVYWGYPNRSTTVRRLSMSLSAPEGANLVLDRSMGEGASGGAIAKDGKVVGIAAAREAQLGYGVISDVAAIALRGWGITLPAPLVKSPAPQMAGAKRSLNAITNFRGTDRSPVELVVDVDVFYDGGKGTDRVVLEALVLEGKAGRFGSVAILQAGEKHTTLTIRMPTRGQDFTSTAIDICMISNPQEGTTAFRLLGLKSDPAAKSEVFYCQTFPYAKKWSLSQPR